MKTYSIAVSWQMYGRVEVEAESLADAISKVESDETPLPEGDYVDGSFEVDLQIAQEEYSDEEFGTERSF